MESGFAGFNRAIDAVRPIGSLVKPAVYLTALEQPSKFTLTSWVQDEPFSVKGADGQVWRPQPDMAGAAMLTSDDDADTDTGRAIATATRETAKATRSAKAAGTASGTARAKPVVRRRNGPSGPSNPGSSR